MGKLAVKSEVEQQSMKKTGCSKVLLPRTCDSGLESRLSSTHCEGEIQREHLHSCEQKARYQLI